MQNEPYLTVVAPVFDERECIEEFLHELHGALGASVPTFECLLVDDGSTDGTSDLLLASLERFPDLRPIFLTEHAGKSAALAAGISEARGRYIALIDSDLQNDPTDIPRMLRLLESDESTDCVVGVRVKRHDSSLRRISSRIANWIARKITRSHGRDAGCGMSVSRRETLFALPFFSGAHRFIATLTTMQGGRVVEFPINHRPRPRGVSKYGNGLGRTFVALRDAMGVRWMMDRKLHYHIRGSRDT